MAGLPDLGKPKKADWNGNSANVRAKFIHKKWQDNQHFLDLDFNGFAWKITDSRSEQ